MRLSFRLHCIIPAMICVGGCAHEHDGSYPPPTDPTQHRVVNVDGLGTFTGTEEGIWSGRAQYEGRPIDVEIGAFDTDVQVVSTYAKQCLSPHGITRANLDADIDRGLERLAWKFDKYNIDDRLVSSDFGVTEVYVHYNDELKANGAIFRLQHPSAVGAWTVAYYESRDGVLRWTPPSNVAVPRGGGG